MFVMCVTYLLYRLVEWNVSDEHNVDNQHNDDVTRLVAAAECQHFTRRQRTTSAVLIKSSGHLLIASIDSTRRSFKWGGCAERKHGPQRS